MSAGRVAQHEHACNASSMQVSRWLARDNLDMRLRSPRNMTYVGLIQRLDINPLILKYVYIGLA